MVTSQGDRLEQEQNQMKKDLAEVKAYAEAMADSNRARDVYVDKEQDKFFRRINRQCVSVPLATLLQTFLGLYRSPTGPGRQLSAKGPYRLVQWSALTRGRYTCFGVYIPV